MRLTTLVGICWPAIAALFPAAALAQQADYSTSSYVDSSLLTKEVRALQDRVAALEAGTDYCSDCCLPPCCEPRCHNTGWVFSAEAIFFKFLKADGVRLGTESGDSVNGDYEITPRLTVGYVGPNGLGIRARWWEYDHEVGRGDDPDEFLAVDTYTIDLELFDTFCLNPYWTIELSGGFRYNEHDEVILDNTENRLADFQGIGGVAAVEVVRCMGRGSVFARARLAMLADDKFILNEDTNDDPPRLDSTQGMVELALGYQYSRCLDNGALFYARAFVEWQNWYNYGESLLQNNNGDELNSGPTDVGFFGGGVSLGVAR